MIQARIIAPNHISLDEVPIPEPQRGECVIKVEAALTCGTDVKAFKRGHPMIPMPGPFGHEYSGIVARVGRGVRRFREGDHIMGVHTSPCMVCNYCKSGLYNHCASLAMTIALGAYAEYLRLPAGVVRRNLHIKPPGLSFEHAAFMEPLACVVHGVGPLKVRPGDEALVLGAGPIGLLHAMVLMNRGARVTIADPNEGKLRTASLLGVAMTVTDGGVHAAMENRTGGLGFDHVFECTGRPEVWERALGYIRPAGVLTLFGGCPRGTVVTFDTYRLHYGECTVRGVFHYTPRDVRKARELLIDRSIDPTPLISGAYPLAELETAFAMLMDGRGVKYVIRPSPR